MTTLKRIEANRRNAKRPTGPKTATGKAVAKWNAVSHGLRTASPVVAGEDLARPCTSWNAVKRSGRTARPNPRRRWT